MYLSVKKFNSDAVAPGDPARTVLGGASLTFLSTRNRQRVFGAARGERGVRAQRRPRGPGDRLDQGAIGSHRCHLNDRRRPWRGAGNVPLFAAPLGNVLDSSLAGI